MSTLSKKLELRQVTKPLHLTTMMYSHAKAKDKQAVMGHKDGQPRITEETSGSNPSSTAKSPEIPDSRHVRNGTPVILPKSGSNATEEEK